MATASFRLVVDRQRRADVRQALAIALRSARGCPGCVDGRIERDTAAGGGLRFHSRWDSLSELHAFLASEEMGRLLQLLELSVEEPEVLICWGDSDAALDALREIRAVSSASRSAATGPSGCGCDSRSQPSNSFSFRE